MIVAQRLTIYGRVQGVGFRPAVCRLAGQFALQGYVRNLGGVVEVVVGGEKTVLAAFVNALQNFQAPIVVEKIVSSRLPIKTFKAMYGAYNQVQDKFFSVASDSKGLLTQMTADIAVCEQCLAEMKDKGNRRYGYSFISCAQCGPRYSIMKRLPYDRANTTMGEMELCPACVKEYRDMAGRRGHGETISCHHCGPQLSGCKKEESNRKFNPKQALEAARQLLMEGKIIIVKAIGGFNLVCRADDESVVAKLRAIKHRPTKPFAVMIGFDKLRQLNKLSAFEKELLTSKERPIVLVEKHSSLQVAENVAACSHELGLMAPSAGLYEQLCEVKVPLVVTSCNFSGAPIIYKDSDAEVFYYNNDIAGLFTYNRDISHPVDDSVVRAVRVDDHQEIQVLRRGRGYIPENIYVKDRSGELIATGADMEPSYCLGNNDKLYIRQLPCDLSEETSEQEWQELVQKDCESLGIMPKAVVSDLHPGYISTALADIIAKKQGIKHYQVQHHHAHALSVVAEHNLQGKVLAVVFDGTGYGPDGTVWGGEFLLCDGLKYKRVAYLEPIKLIGGDTSMKQAWKSGLCYQANLQSDAESSDERYSVIKSMLANNVNVVRSSSMGRLFDAVAYSLNLADYNSHQGYCGQLLEKHSLEGEQNRHSLKFTYHINENKEIIWSAAAMLEKMLQLKTEQNDKYSANMAADFHQAIVDMINATVNMVLPRYGIRKVALSGGCFANKVLLEKVINELEYWRVKVYFNQQVPPGDGGIALGQAYYGSLKLAEDLAKEDK